MWITELLGLKLGRNIQTGFSSVFPIPCIKTQQYYVKLEYNCYFEIHSIYLFMVN